MKRTIALILSMLFVATFASAQAKAPLRILCNVSGAQVFLSGQLVGNTTPNLILNVRVGNYPLKIIKKGYNDFDMTVNVGGEGATVRANLQPRGAAPAPNSIQAQPAPNNKAQLDQNVQTQDQVPAPDQRAIERRAPAPNVIVAPQNLNYDLVISSNVNGADVIINGNPAGRTPFRAQVPSGSYTLLIRAQGFLEFSQNIVVNNGPTQINAVLQPLSFQVSVNANVQGAAVIINGQQLGQTPFATALVPGTYALIVRAPGYLDYQAQIAVNGPQAINAGLQQATATWQFQIPDTFADKRGQEQRRNLQLSLDGVQQNSFSGQIFPGRHTIRIAMGGLAVETQVDIQAGRSYIFTPTLGINVQ
jgi:hypothetical protein